MSFNLLFTYSLLSAQCHISTYHIVLLIIMAVLSVVICFLLIPVAIRMAGQLITQVFKYRYILKEHVTDSDDQQVITGYYQHFQITLGIVMCMLGFNVSNVIYQIYLTISVNRKEWGRQYELGVVAGAVTQSFKEGILLFGICLSLQINNYFTRKRFHFRRLCVAILLRMVYIILFKCVSVISSAVITDTMTSLSITLALFCLNGIDVITRVFSVFAFIRMCLIIVNNHIKEFTNHINTRYLDSQRYEDKIKAYKLMRIAAWGTYSLAIFQLIDLLCDISIMPYTLQSIPQDNIVIGLTSAGGVIVTILSILPTVLYSIFLLLLWTFFRHRTRVKYSGYRTMDVDKDQLFADKSLFTNQDNLHHIYYKHKNKVHLISYAVLIISVCFLFTVFLTPLMIERTQEIVTLLPGDYHALGDSQRNCEIINYSFSKDRRIPPNFHGSAEPIDCSEHLKGVNFEKTQMQTVTNIYNFTIYKAIAWIPQNSTIKYFKPPDNGNFTIKDLTVFSSIPCPTPDYISKTYCNFNNNLMSAEGNNYSIQESGIYQILPPFLYEPIGPVLLNISRSMYQTTGEVPFSQFTQNNVITQLDAIVYEYPHIVTVTKEYETKYCELNIVCYFSPIWSILFGIAVFSVCMFVYLLLLYLIHKKR